jgi:replicative DNA helicase
VTDTYATAADALLAAGWHPLPVLGTDKAAVPPGFTGYRGKYPAPADVARWKRQHPDRNLAIRLPRDVVALDVDAYDGKPGAATLAELETRLGPLPPTYVVTAREAPSGKYLYRVPNGTAFRGTAGPGVDVVAWHVRYVVAAGTHHTGAPVRWVDSASGEELGEVPEPGDLPELPWAWLEYLSASGSGHVADGATAEAVAEWLEEHTDAHRPTWSAQVVRGLEERIAAGEGRHPSTVAVLCQVAREATAGAYPAAEAVAAVRGVWEQVTAGENRGEEFGELLGWAVGQLAAEDGPERVDAVRERMGLPPLADPPPAGGEDPDPWPELDPLDRHRLPPFPVRALPGWAAEFVTASARSLQVPLDLVGVMVLGAIAATTTGRVRVRVRPDYAEPLNLWAAVVADPGERKSPAVAAATGPVRAAEADLAADTADERARLAQERRVLERRAKAAEEDASRVDASGLADALAAATDAREAAEAVQVPPEPRFLAGDATPEAVVQVAAAQGGRIALVSDEVGPLADMGRRYSSSGAANLDAFLVGWSGGPYRVDRTGRTGEHLDALSVTVIVAAQPAAAAAMFTDENRGRGVVARVLWSWPGTLLGRRDPDPPTVPEAVAAAYAAHLGALAEELYRLEPAEVKLSAAADRLRVEFAAEVEPRLAPGGGDLAELDGWASKLPGNVVRCAGLLHVAEHGPRGEVSAETMTAAAELGRYFTAHATRVWGDSGRLEDLAGARKVRAWLLRQGDPPQFTAREVHRGAFAGGRSATAEEVAAYLRLLAGRGYVRELERTPGKVGAPASRWELRPALATAEADCVDSVSTFPENDEPDGGPLVEDL